MTYDVPVVLVRAAAPLGLYTRQLHQTLSRYVRKFCCRFKIKIEVMSTIQKRSVGHRGGDTGSTTVIPTFLCDPLGYSRSKENLGWYKPVYIAGAGSIFALFCG